jgi:hypothetical protein
VAREDIEPYGQAGISGSDIGDEGFRLASGVGVGPPGNRVAVPPRAAPPPPAPLPRMRRGVSMVGQAPTVRPELLRDEDTIDGQSARITAWCVRMAGATVLFVALMVWLNLAHKL